MEGVHRVALEIATRRAQKLSSIKQSLLEKNTKRALDLMQEFFGLSNADGAKTCEHDEASNRTNSRFH